MKRIFAVMLALLMCTAAWAESYETTEDIPLNASDDKVVLTDWADRLVETPELVVPDTLEAWEEQRADISAMVWDTLGSIPPRPEAPVIETYETGETPIMTYEKFYMDDAYGDDVPGTIYIPKGLEGKAPAILYLHYHGDEFETGQNEVLFSWPLADEGQPLVDEFIKRGYVVMAIDAYAFTTRSGQGPGVDPDTGAKETGLAEEASLYKYFTVQGLSYMGMILRDDQCALDYLSSREEVDAARIGVTGMSMGGTRANWLAALDERVKVTVSVACLTRMQDFIKTGNIKWHAFFNWVPGMLARFDTEQVVSLIAPRNYVQLMGTEDIGSPLSGVKYIQDKMEQVYALYDASDKLEFHYYEGLDHDYLPEEFELMLDYFDANL
ncbi:MAG: dienelactone hydrolase [Clostridiales bacterium]|nr:dienelactone hydrolase [Clostridiales bacterium]